MFSPSRCCSNTWNYAHFNDLILELCLVASCRERFRASVYTTIRPFRHSPDKVPKQLKELTRCNKRNKTLRVIEVNESLALGPLKSLPLQRHPLLLLLNEEPGHLFLLPPALLLLLRHQSSLQHVQLLRFKGLLRWLVCCHPITLKTIP